MSRPKKPLEMRVCPNCAESFAVRRKHQRFCSKDCRMDQWLRENPRVYMRAQPADNKPVTP